MRNLERLLAGILLLLASSVGVEAQVGPCTDPMSGTARLRFSVGTTIHEAQLDLRGCSGTMTVRYYNEELRRTEAISERMEVRSSPRGTLILGFDPVYFGISRRHWGYAADNLLVQRDVSGEVLFQNCDDGNQCSLVEVVSAQLR